MIRDRSWLMPVMTFSFAAVLVGTTVAQPPGGRRGLGMARMGTLLGLLRFEQVQEELKLTDEQKAKITQVGETLRGEMREQFMALRDTQDEEGRQAKMTEMMREFDRKTREQLRDVMEREQMMRLYQIRSQVRPVVDSLANEWVANRLELTDDQKEKVAQLSREMQAKRFELFRSMRGASDDQRAEARQKSRELRSDVDQKALAILTAEQKTSFEEMQGEKFELNMGGPR
jgi:Spy/CpxP family protein refolding chaperone